MNNQEILIDGVNVAECEFYRQNTYDGANCCCLGQKPYCQTNPNCYFKQLAREKQINKELEKQCDENSLHITQLAMENINLIRILKEIRKITCFIESSEYSTNTQRVNTNNSKALDNKEVINPCNTCDVEPPAMKFKCPECEYGGNNE